MKETIAQTGNEYQLRFSGNGVSPTTVPVHELCDVLSAFDNAIRLIITDKDTHANEATLYLVSVDNESLGLRTISNYAAKTAVAISLITSTITSQVYSGIPEKSIAEIEKIIRFTHRHNCIGEINGITNGVKTNLATITADTEIKRPAESTIKGNTSIFAFVQWAGGVNPRVHLLLPDEKTLNCKANREIIQNLKIYDWHTFHGQAEWDATNGKLLAFNITGAVHRENKSAYDAFSKISERFGHIFDNQSPDDFFNEMRRGE